MRVLCLVTLSMLAIVVATAITSPAQIFTTLVNFDGTNGAAPQPESFAEGRDGNLYGTTRQGGANNSGTVFEMTPAGTLTTHYTFCSQPGCTDGNGPAAALVQAADGNFYGATGFGGAFGDGTVFRITASGNLTTLHTFDGKDGNDPNSRPVPGKRWELLRDNRFRWQPRV